MKYKTLEIPKTENKLIRETSNINDFSLILQYK